MNKFDEGVWVEVLGVLVGIVIVITIIAPSLYHKNYSSSCEKEFDVYQCE